MLRLSVQQAWRRRRRLVGAALSVALGVAFLAGTLTVGSSIEGAYADLFEVAGARNGVVVRNATSVGDLAGRGTIPPEVVPLVEAVAGVDAAVPRVEGPGTIVGEDGQRVGDDALQAVAGTWVADPDRNPYRLADGRAPAERSEVVIDRGVADDGGLSVGDRTTVLLPAAHEVTVVGIATYGSADARGTSTFVGLEAGAAAELLGLPAGAVSEVLVAGRPGTGDDELAARVARVLPRGVEAVTGEEVAAEELDAIGATFLDSVRTFLAAFSLVVLLVAAMSIANTLSILGAQRTRDAALLRTVGATRRQVLTGSLAEAAGVGLVASAAGVAAGSGIAALLLRLFDAAGMPLPRGLGVRLSVGNLGLAFVVGVVVTVVAGAWPAVRASRVSPLDAQRRAAAEPRRLSRRRWVAGIVVLVVGTLVAAIAGAAGAGGAVALGGAAALVGLALVVPGLATTLGRAAERAFGRTATRQLAARNTRRNPRRTAGTAVALAVALGVVTLIAVVVSSLQAGTGAGLERSLRAPAVLTTGVFEDRGVATEVVEAISADERVGSVAAVGGGRALVEGQSELVTALDPAAVSGLLDLGASRGGLTGLSIGELAVSAPAAGDAGWDLGDTVAVTFADGERERLTVAAVYDEPAVVGDYVVTPATWARHGPGTARLVLAAPAGGHTEADALAALRDVAEASGRPEVFDRTAWVAAQTAMLDRLLGTIFVLLGVGVLISLASMANALSLALYERRTEVGLLRIVGQTTAQVRSMVRWESALVATLGTVIGVAAGVFCGWSVVSVVASDALPMSFGVPVGSIVVIAAVGVGASTLSAVRPARRILRLDPLATVRAE